MVFRLITFKALIPRGFAYFAVDPTDPPRRRAVRMIQRKARERRVINVLARSATAATTTTADVPGILEEVKSLFNIS